MVVIPWSEQLHGVGTRGQISGHDGDNILRFLDDSTEAACGRQEELRLVHAGHAAMHVVSVEVWQDWVPVRGDTDLSLAAAGTCPHLYTALPTEADNMLLSDVAVHIKREAH